MTPNTISIEATTAPVISRPDIVVVGGGPAGLSAAVAAARSGASVSLVERYPHLGGMAAGGMVLVLDDIVDEDEITVRGIAQEMIDRLEVMGLAVYPPPEDRVLSEVSWEKWRRWGAIDFHQQGEIKPIIYSVAFDPEGWKTASHDMIDESGVELRLHSPFHSPIMEGGKVTGVICHTKTGPEALLADVVVDCSGDADVAFTAGAPFVQGSYLVTTVFRLGNVDTHTAMAFDRQDPRAAYELDREAKRILGGAWEHWWLLTPLPGVVWCNAPHMTGYDGLTPGDQTAANAEGRRRVAELLEFARARMPGFEQAVLVDVAPQLGVRQTRLIRGDYVVTKDDVVKRHHFSDSVARGRGYYTPYRSLLPLNTEGLLVAGRHYSVEPDAQKLSREIPPCMAMGEAAGIAAAMAAQSSCGLRDIDVSKLQQTLRSRGADPGDIPSLRAVVDHSAQMATQ
ncbi:MAG: FAD-dependent oxidoreductase [bacterium]|nr:FAD-dependent oxidoreductase [bacterium]